MYARKVPLFLGTFKSLWTACASLSCLLSVYTVIHQLHFLQFFGAKDGSRTRNLQLGRLELYQLSYFRLILLLTMRQPSFNVGTGGFEPPKSKQQIYSLSHLATLVYPHFKKSRRRDSNPRPTDYKSVALPAELLRLIFLILKNVPFKWGCKFNNNFCCCKKKYNFFWFFSKIIILPLFLNKAKEGITLLYPLCVKQLVFT